MISTQIDVIVCSKKPTTSLFEKCIHQLLAQTTKINKIIVVYRESIDKILVHPKLQYIKEPAKSCLAYARFLGIQASSSEYICFVDDDVLLGKNHIAELYQKQKAYNCVIEGVLTILDQSIRIPTPLYQDKILRNSDRGFTHNTLIARHFVSDWIPPQIHAFEDYSLTRHIQQKGVIWYRYQQPTISYHIKTYNQLKRTRWATAGSKTLGIVTWKSNVKSIITHCKRAIIHPFLLKNSHYFLFNIKMAFGKLTGYYNSNKYSKLS